MSQPPSAPSSSTRRPFHRTLIVVFLVFSLLFALELGFEWVRLGRPGADAMSWAGTNNAKLVDLMSPIARAYNNILAMLIATIGLAIPLTANIHTPRLIEMFLSDRLNQIVLYTGAFCAANVLWVAWSAGPNFAPTWAITAAVYGALAGWALLIPYFFYVVRFLDPTNILARLERDVETALGRVASGRAAADPAQALVARRLGEIGLIVIKAMDRSDRDVALQGIWTFKRLLDHHGARKSEMPADWFVVDRADFVGLSMEAIALVSEERCFFERKVLHQLYLAYTHAIGKSADICSSVSDANRVVAAHAAQRGDNAALELSLRMFNSFLRESIRQRHTHSLYDVFLQYRLLAEQLPDRAETVEAVARHIQTYALEARRVGLPFVCAVAAFDLAAIAATAHRVGCPLAGATLNHALAMPRADVAVREDLVLQARLKLGGALSALGDTSGVARVRASLAQIPAEDLRCLAEQLVGAPRVYPEVTDRQIDLRWVPPEDRASVLAFAEGCGAAV